MKQKSNKISSQKLISEYAEKLILYMKENKSLKTQIKDLKISLSINKEMLNNQIKTLSTEPDSKNHLSEIIINLQKENNQITERNNQLYNDNLSLEKKIYSLKQEMNEKIKNYDEQIKEANNKIFILSNQLIEKDNIIKQYKNELLNIYKEEFNNENFICTSPSKFNLELNNELCEARQIIIKYSHLLNDSQKLINEQNIKIISLKEMIQNIKDGKRVKRNLENIENFGYILTEDSNESENNEFKSFYIEDDNGDIIEEIDIDDNNCDSPLVQLPNKIKNIRYLTTTTSNEVLVPKLDLSTIIKKYKPIEKKEKYEKKKDNLSSIILHNNYIDDRDYIDKLKFQLKFYKNIIYKYKQKLKEQKKIISMLKKHCLKSCTNLNTNCSTSDSKIKNYPISNDTRSNNNNNINGYSMENNINFSIDSEIDDNNELNVIINEVNREAIGILSETNSFYNNK